jgi:hypothetical protein
MHARPEFWLAGKINSLSTPQTHHAGIACAPRRMREFIYFDSEHGKLCASLVRHFCAVVFHGSTHKLKSSGPFHGMNLDSAHSNSCSDNTGHRLPFVALVVVAGSLGLRGNRLKHYDSPWWDLARQPPARCWRTLRQRVNVNRHRRSRAAVASACPPFGKRRSGRVARLSFSRKRKQSGACENETGKHSITSRMLMSWADEGREAVLSKFWRRHEKEHRRRSFDLLSSSVRDMSRLT